MAALTDQSNSKREMLFLSLAREIAMDILPLEKILENHKVDPDDWTAISRNHRFRVMLDEAVRIWESADNIDKRVKTKFLSTVEESIPEMYARLHDKSEPLAAKVQLFTALQKGAGIGFNPEAGGGGGGGSGFQLVINIGEGQEHKIQARSIPVIDGEVVDQ
jgi:hypothetical protein